MHFQWLERRAPSLLPLRSLSVMRPALPPRCRSSGRAGARPGGALPPPRPLLPGPRGALPGRRVVGAAAKKRRKPAGGGGGGGGGGAGGAAGTRPAAGACPGHAAGEGREDGHGDHGHPHAARGRQGHAEAPEGDLRGRREGGRGAGKLLGCGARGAGRSGGEGPGFAGGVGVHRGQEKWRMKESGVKVRKKGKIPPRGPLTGCGAGPGGACP